MQSCIQNYHFYSISGNSLLENSVISCSELSIFFTLIPMVTEETRFCHFICFHSSHVIVWFLDNQELYCVRMYGLPFRASEYQVASWFGDANANCVDVQFHLNHQGKKSGDATAFFTSPEEAKKGVGKDKHDMNGRFECCATRTFHILHQSPFLGT